MSRKSRKRRSSQSKTAKPTPAPQPRRQIIIIGVVATLIGAVLIIKNWASSPNSQAGAQVAIATPTVTMPTASPTAASLSATAQLPSPAAVPQLDPNSSPAAQLEQLLTTGHPTLAFFHSNTCHQCIEMTKIVNQVHPEFADTVALVDVNVYDQRNAELLRLARIRVIPTLIFFDRAGQSTATFGLLEPAQLRQKLQALEEEH